MPQTRNQKDMKRALELVSSLEQADPELKRIYGGLCHSFPVMVLQSGLCQAVAFSAAKTSSEDQRERARARAHQKLLEHLGAILEVEGDLLAHLHEAPTTAYMHHTRRVLEAWVYFKRFAKSVLKVEAGGDDEGR